MTADSRVPKLKLIEVALPLEAINRESAREKSIRHGHPSTLHLWWARRPLAAARAVLFAQLVDDPSSRPDEFPTEELQRKERERLHKLIERLVVWENIRDEKLLAEAHAEILKSTNGNPPPILDPFAGGGTIPLEAQRLGLAAHASDLNPVAVLINKALIETPPSFRDQPPVFPGLAESEIRLWKGAEGLAADVRAYGTWMRDEAETRIGYLYPKATLSDGSKATVIAWIWARTVRCSNPGCGVALPLVSSWWLGKKKGKEAYVVPSVVPDQADPSGHKVCFTIAHDRSGPTIPGTVQGRNGAACLACSAVTPISHIKKEGRAGKLLSSLIAIVAEGQRQRIYLPPDDKHLSVAAVQPPSDLPTGELSLNSQYMGAPLYGMTDITDLFTDRQLLMLSTASDLVNEARARIINDGGTSDYADALSLYLTIGVSKAADYHNALCGWRSDVKNEGIGHLFSRQAIPIVWDYCEANPFSNSSGNLRDQWNWVAKALELVPARGTGSATQQNAINADYEGTAVCTDPPYYDNVPYADLADFFYVWLRRTLRDIEPQLFSTLLVPKTDELVANPLRQGGKEGAKTFFEKGFEAVFGRVRDHTDKDLPTTVFYAFRQSESVDGAQSSTGWETLLEAMLRAGWSITSTWPLRSEMGNRTRSINSNALASSIVLSLRRRSSHAATVDRRDFIAALEHELPAALRNVQAGSVAPVDLPQAAIGPGMAVFTRFGAVLEPDGQQMSVRSALARINEILDKVLNEQEGDFDSSSRFAIAWYRQHGYTTGKYGDAELLANARGAVVQSMDREGILVSRSGNVHLMKPEDLSDDYDVVADLHTSNWEALHYLIKVLQRDGISPAGDFLRAALSRPDGAVDADLVKELAHLLFRIAESQRLDEGRAEFQQPGYQLARDPGCRTADTPTASTQSAFDFSEEDD